MFFFLDAFLYGVDVWYEMSLFGARVWIIGQIFDQSFDQGEKHRKYNVQFYRAPRKNLGQIWEIYEFEGLNFLS